MHEDIDRKDDEDTSSSAWHQFLNWFHEIIYERVLLKESNEVDINVRRAAKLPRIKNEPFVNRKNKQKIKKFAGACNVCAQYSGNGIKIPTTKQD
jgi:hypothetical protein